MHTHVWTDHNDGTESICTVCGEYEPESFVFGKYLQKKVYVSRNDHDEIVFRKNKTIGLMEEQILALSHMAHNPIIGAPEHNLKKSLASLINKHSLETLSDTPDFILATYLLDCIDAFNKAALWGRKWHSVNGVPPDERENGPTPPKVGK